MKPFHQTLGVASELWRLKGWTACGIALAAFLAGSLLTARLAQPTQASADGNRVFELRVYHAVPGKVPALEERFRNTTSRLLAKHDLKVVGFWVPVDTPAWDNTLIFMVAHDSREDAKRNWDVLRVDPQFLEMVKSEQAEKLVERIDSTYMRPTDFSAMK